ncbi:hypothetical protein N9755_00435 [bacterium]|jgi:hypothetical protein|nr:hypothetical protein [Paracoccaceae bacterium]MDB4185681.1 hypothetical protein [bacterium]MDB9945233.1 hypothetical protein [Ascidiaceihabitans sp.]MDC1275357.1 hypothetical protein [Ascidiaceihabitans sp.]HCI08325.1 hypothetical protein [Sulfitobacter sp.]
MSIKLYIAAIGVSATLAGCGETGTDQALLGGAAGAGLAIVADANPVKGVVIGAAGNFLYCQTYPNKCN